MEKLYPLLKNTYSLFCAKSGIKYVTQTITTVTVGQHPKRNYYIIPFLMMVFLYSNVVFAQNGSTTFSTAGTTTWTCPSGVTTVTVQCWGGGGGGGGVATASNTASGGGAGGSYTSNTVTVVPGTTYSVTVGAGGTGGTTAGTNGNAGGSSSFNVTSIVAVGGPGGTGGTAAGSYAGGVGTATGNTAGTNFAGGNGAAGASTTIGGGGGGAAGSTTVGGNAVGSTAGTGGATGGGNGATGVNNATGGTGTIPGGGGSGTRRTNTSRAGGAGGAGSVVVTYVNPAPTIEAFSNQVFCASTFTTPTAYNTVNFSLVETAVTNFDANQTNQTLILILPAGFQFNTAAGTVTNNAVIAQDITIGAVTITTTSVTVSLTTAATQVNIDEINFNGFQIRATASPSSGDLVRTGGTFKVNGSASTPTNLQSFGHLATSSPSVYNSSSVSQYTTSTIIRGCTSTSNPILEFKANITGGLCTPNDVITQFVFSTTGSTAPLTDITQAEIYYTDTAQGFSNANFFGSATSPNGTFTITGSQGLNLGNGPYYFYLAYTVPGTAVIGDVVDASMTSFTFNGTTYTNMATPNPAGSRSIVSGTCLDAGDSPPPVANTQTITAGSLVIPMDNTNQLNGGVFNLKAYGLVHSLLQNDIPVKWVIKSGKTKDAVDFTANATKVYPTAGTATNYTFIASEFVVDSYYVDHPYYGSGLTATQVMAAFAVTNSVTVVKLNTDVAVDVRYTLNHRPKIAVFSNGGYDSVQTRMLTVAGVTNYFVQNAGDFTGLAECYTFCSEAHWAYASNPDTRPVQRVVDFVNEGGNFLAQCAGIDLYENHQPAGGHFQTTGGVSFNTTTITNTDYNPDMAFCQYQGQVTSEIGVISAFWPIIGSSIYKNETYYGVSKPTVTNTVVASGIHVANPDSVGSNVFYLGGHSYNSSGAGNENGVRMYLNATLIPARRPTAFPITLPANPTICAGQTVSIGPVCASGASYSWGPGTALSSSTTCNPIASPTTTTTYSVVGVNGGCIMGPSSITVSVNPTPVMTSTNSATICGNGSVSIPLTSNLTSTYQWIAADNPNTTGESITTQTTSTLNNTIVNTTTSVQTVIYTVTPTSTLGSCTGTPQTVTVTVNPAPTMSSANTATICANATVNIPLTANIAGSTFTWIATDNTNTTGESLTTQTTATLSNTITNSTISSQNVIYTITPTAGGCLGTAQTATVTVNPTPVMTSTTTATLCSGGTVSIPLTSNIASTYSWIAADNLNTTGESLTTQSTNTLSNSITNSSTSSQDVIYSVTPTAGGCSGTTQTVTVTVNPTPSVTSAGTATICTGATVNISLTSNVAGSTFTWIATDNTNTTGESLTTQSTNTLSNTIVNGTTSAQNVIYTVTPFAGGCPGTAQTVTVTVNPTPAMTSASTATICSGAAVSIPFTSNVASTYTWIATDNTNTTGESLTTQSTATLNNTITNSTTSAQNVIYTVTPTSTGGSCTGTSQTITVTVNPIPAMTSASTASICSGGTASITLTSNVASTYTWIATDNTNTTGESLTTQSTGTLSNTIVNNTTSVQNVIYTVTPTSTTGSCAGTSQTITVTVNPNPTMTSASTATICSGAAVSIPFTSNVASTYTWIATDNVNTTGESLTTQATATLNNTITNSSTSVQNVIYTVTPTSTGGSCAGTSQTITVTVNPTPAMTSANTASICSGAAVSIPFTSNVASTYTWIATDNVNTTGESLTTQATATLNNTITNTTTSAQNVIYTVTPTSTTGSCAGTSQTITVTVNPTPAMTSASTSTICTGSTVNITLTGTVAGSTFTWIATDNVNTTGESLTTQNTATLSNTITNGTTSAQNVIYTVTPTFGGCTGAGQTVTVTVNPTPTMTSANTSTICSGGTASIPLTSNVPSTFTWIATDNVNTTGESLTTQSTATLSNTITNSSTSVQNVIYTVTPTSTGGSCAGTAQTVTITVNPKPAMTSASTATICSGASVSIPFTSNVASTYTWIATDNVNTTGESLTTQATSTLSNTITNSTAVAQNVIYTVTPTSTGGSCVGTAQTITVTVNPAPAMTSANSATICTGATVSIPFTSNVASTYTWIATDNVNTTGESLTTQSTATLSNTITNGTAVLQNVIYTVTPTSTGGSCAGAAQTITVQVNPVPTATATPSTQTICSAGATSIALTSNIAGTTYSWTVSQSGVSGASASSGSNITQTLTTTGTSPGTATYTITPVNGCTGSAIVATVTVNPTPAMTSASTATICSGATASITLTSNVASTYTWIAANNASTTGESLTTQSTATLSNTITNNTTSAQNVIYTVTPTSTGGSCVGTSQTVTVTVNPTPTATATPSSQTICSAGATSIALTSNIAGTTYSWTTSQSGVTGASNSSGANITQTLTATSTSAGTATYTITPTSTLGSCAGATLVVPITVNPIPTVTATPTSQTFCSGNTTSIALTSGVAGTTYSWTVTQTGVSGASAASGSSIAQTISTTGTATGTAVYTITPTASSCSGTAITATVTVNPAPAMTSASSATICTGATVSIPFTSNVASTYTWIATDNVNTTGESLTTQSTATLSNIITNGTTVSQNVIYTVTPTSTGGSCAGAAQTVTVEVNPVPTATATPSSQTICSAGATSITLTSNIAGTTYSWTNTQSGVTGASNSSGSSITQTLTTTGTSTGTVTYTITPVNGCAGSAIVATVTVNPTPTMTSANTATICSGGTVSIPLTSNVASNYIWIATNNPNTTGESTTTQSTNTLSNTITDNTTTTQSVIYTVTPTSTGGSCAGTAQTVTVTVNPVPTITATPSSQTLCSGLATSIALTSSIGTSTFSWTVSQAGVSGASNSSGANITQTLTATSTSAGTATYTITPTAGACPGTALVVPITVNPIPTVTATPTSQAFCSGNTTSIALTSGVAGTTYSWTVTQTGVSGASAASGSSIAQTISTTGTATGTAVYTITPTASSCSGTAITATVTVNPVPAMTSAGTATICSSGTVNIPLTSNVASTYTWIATNNPNTTGESITTQTTSTLNNTLVSTTGNTEVVVYTVTPTSTGGSCAGVAQTVSVTVSPTPIVTVTPTSQALCSGNVTSIALTSNVVGTIFNWTETQSGVSGASASSGSSITQTLTTTGVISGTVTYTITPTIGTCTGTAVTATVTVNPIPSATATPSSQAFCSGNATSIALTSNVAATTYSWTVSQSGVSGATSASGTNITQTLTTVGTTSGTATYTITPSTASCSGTPIVVTVTVNPVPTATATPATQALCSGSATSIALTSNVAGTTFSWTDTQTGATGASASSGATITQTLTATGASQGTVTYTITPVAGTCTGSTTVATVTVNPIPVAPTASSNSPVCISNTITFSVVAVAGATYSWTGPNSFTANVQNPSITNATLTDAGTYSVNVTVNGCTGPNKTVTVVVNPPPPSTLTASSNSPVCTGQTLSLSTPSVTAASYSWTGPNSFSSSVENPTISNVTIAANGTYTVSATVPGCGLSGTGTVSVVVNPTPVAPTAGNNGPLCVGATLNLTASNTGTTYSWTGPNTFTANTQNPSITNITSAGAGVYSVTATSLGCTSTKGTTNVIVNPIPATPTVTSNSPICVGQTLNLSTSAVGGASYSWNGPNSYTSSVQNPSISNAAVINAGTYSLAVTVSGCTSATGTVNAVINSTPVTPTASVNNPVCVGDTLFLSATSTGGATYSWTGPNTFTSNIQNPIIAGVTATANGTYTVIANNGCASGPATVTVAVSPTPAAPVAGSNSPLCVGSTLNLTATNTGATYNWSGPNTFTSSVRNPSIANITSADAGVYTVTATSAVGCVSPTATVNVVINSPAIVSAGGGQTVCANNAQVTLNGTSSTGSAQWSSAGTGTFTPNNTTLTATYTPSATEISAGTATLTLASLNNGACAAVTDQMVITITPSPTVSAGGSQTVCANNAQVTLNGTFSVASGISWSSSGTGTFNPDNVTASTTYSPSTTDITAGTVTLTITTTGNGTCLAATNTMVVTIKPAPVVNGGADIFVCSNNPNAALNGTSSTGAAQWSTSGTGTFTPNNTTLNATYISSASDISGGVVTLTLTSTNNTNCLAVADTLTIKYTAPPTVNAGAGSSVCANNSAVALSGTSSTGSGSWTTSGTGTFTPNNTTLNATYHASAADATAGVVTLTLTSTNNGGCVPVTSALTITVTPSPIANAGTDQSVCGNNANVALTGSVTVATGGTWSSTGTGTFSPNNTNMSTTYIPSNADTAAGSVKIILTTSGNGNCNATKDTMLVTITNAPSISAGADANVCLNSPNHVLNGSSSTGSATWSTLGTGTFTPNNTTLNATYVPSSADTSIKHVTLILTSANNGGCNAVKDTMKIVYTNLPTVNAGSNQTVCGNNAHVTLSGSSSTGSGAWTTSGTGTFTPNNTTLNGTYIPSNADTASGNITLTITATGGCATVTQTISVVITNAPGAHAGADVAVCANNATVTLNGNVSGATSTGIWSTNGTGTFTPNNTTLNASYTPSSSDTTAGSVTMILTSSGNGTCLAATDTMKITYTHAPHAHAGSDATVCANNAVVLSGSVSGGTGNGIWTTTNGSGTFAPSNTTLNASYNTVNADTVPTSVMLILTSTNNGGCLASSDTMLVTVNPGPIVNAGTDQTMCANNVSIALSGTVAIATGGQWSSLGTGTFTPNNTTLNANYNPSAAEISSGTITLMLTSTGNGLCQAVTDTMKVHLTPAPVVNAGADIFICNSGMSTALNGSISGGSTTGQWTTVGSGTFTPNANTLNATYNLSTADTTAGMVKLVLTSTNNLTCNAVTDTVVIKLNSAPNVFAGNDTTVCGSVSTIALNGSISGGITGHWTTHGNGTFAPNDSTLNGTYNVGSNDISAGSVVLTLTSNVNGQCPSSSDSVKITFSPAIIVNAGSNIPVCSGVMTAQLNGSVSGGSTTGQWTTLGSGTFTPNDSTLNAVYNLSAADTSAGSVTLVLTSTHNGGCSAVSNTVVITMSSSPITKAGNDTSVCGTTVAVQLHGNVTGGSGAGVWTSNGTGTFAPNDSTLNATYHPSAADASTGAVTLTLSSINNGSCPQSVDSMKLTITPAPIVNAGSNIAICNGVMTTPLNGNVSGGSTTGQWSTLGSGAFTPNDTTLNATYNLSVADSTAGNVSLVLTSTHNGSCSVVRDTVLITLNSVATVFAGNDTSICSSVNSLQLNGTITGGSPTGQWTSTGTGTFTPNDSTLNATYQPSAADVTAGNITLTLASTHNCVNKADSLKLAIMLAPVVNAGSNISICNGVMSTALSGTVTGGTNTGIWSTLGSGLFTPNDSTLNATYNLSVADSTAGNVSLVLSSTHNGSCSVVRDTVLITLNSTPAVVAGNDTSICSSTNSITLHGTVTGGTGTGLWTSNGTGTFTPNDSTLNATYQPSAADVTAGSVMLALTATHNCVNKTDSLKLTIQSAPVVNAGSNIAICGGVMSTVLSGTVSGGASTAQWATLGSGTFTPNDSTLNATYHLSVADSTAGNVTLVLSSTHNGSCSVVRDTVLITLNSTPVINAGHDTTVCSGASSVQLNGSINGGSGTGVWSSAGTGTFTPDSTTLNANYNPSAGDITNGSVTLVLTSTNSCVNKSDTMKITFAPTATVSAGRDTSICSSSVIALNGSVTVGSVAHWSTIGTGTFTPNDSTLNATYTPAVTDNDTLTFVLAVNQGGSCGIVRDTMIVHRNGQPSALFSVNNSCLGQSVSFTDNSTAGGGSISTWYWNFGTGDTSTTKNPTYTYTTSGTYTVHLVVSAGGNCKDSISKTINIHAVPVPSFTLSANCISDSATFTNSSTISQGNIASWSWNFGDGHNASTQNPHHLYDSLATYTVSLTAVSDSGCSASITHTVVVHPSPLAGLAAQSNCLTLLVNFKDTSKVILPDSISSYNWSFGDGSTSIATNPSHTYSTSGTYTVLLQVQTNNGCKDTATKIITTGQPIVADYTPAGGSYNVHQDIDFTSQVTGASTYNWNFGDNSTASTLPNPSHGFNLAGTYTVTLVATNSMGCSDTVRHTFEVNPSGHSIPTGFTPNGDGLNDYFYIMGGPFSQYELRVFNEWGQQIFMSNSQSDKWDGTFMGTKQPAGTYMYIFNGNVDGKSLKLSGEINLIQ
jgi:gliding motility-associated-like protein